MNNNVTQDNASASRLFPSTKDNAENDCISRLQESRRPSLPEEEEILRPLDQIRYTPRQSTIRHLLDYAEQTLKDEVNKPH